MPQNDLLCRRLLVETLDPGRQICICPDNRHKGLGVEYIRRVHVIDLEQGLAFRQRDQLYQHGLQQTGEVCQSPQLLADVCHLRRT